MGDRWNSQNRKNVYLSPYVEEPLNSKVIKSFVPEQSSRKCFSCFEIPMFHVYVIYIYVLSLWTLRIFYEQNETQFILGSGHIGTAIWLHYMDSNKTAGEEARQQLHKNAASNLEQVLAATPHKTPTVRPPASYHENYSS